MPPLRRRAAIGHSLSREEQAQGLLLRRLRLRRRRYIQMGCVGLLGVFLLVAQVSGLLARLAEDGNHALEDVLISAGLTVQSIQVTGRDHTDAIALRAALEVARGQSLLHLDLDDMRRRVEALDWVKTADLYRSLPNRLVLHIEEREAFALWQYEGKLRLIDPDGVVITSADARDYPGLPLVVGKGAPDDAAELEKLLAAEPQLAQDVDAAIRVGDRRWNIRFKNGVEARLPQEHPEAAWAELAKLERQHGILERDIVHVDLRLPGKLIIRPRELRVDSKGRKARI